MGVEDAVGVYLILFINRVLYLLQVLRSEDWTTSDILKTSS